MSDDNFLFGQGVRTVKFPTIGSGDKGKILNVKVEQKTEFKTNKPEFYASGDPIMQLVIDVQRAGGPVDDEDDGERRFYIDNKRKRESVKDAMAAVGVTKGLPKVGGDFGMKWSGEETHDKDGNKLTFPAKTYDAVYADPSVVPQADDAAPF